MHPKPEGSPITFGDVIEADWLFDIYLREQAQPLTAVAGADRQILRYLPASPDKTRPGGKDYAAVFSTDEGLFPGSTEGGTEGEAEPGSTLAFGNKRKAIVLTDECEAAKVIDRGGRLLLAALVPWPTAPREIEALEGKNGSSWRRFALPANGTWEGAVVDFSKHVAVWHEAIPHGSASFAMSDTEAGLLKVAWTAYATRHGPIVGKDGIRKLVEILRNGDDQAKWSEERLKIVLTDDQKSAMDRFADLCDAMFTLEGPVLDSVAAAHETKTHGGPELDLVLQQLALVQATAAAAEAALRKVS